MLFVEQNFPYIKECAECRAREIAEILGNRSDIDDHIQDIYYWICKRAVSYDPKRGTPKTFIAMAAVTAKKRILRKYLRKKNRMIYAAKHL